MHVLALAAVRGIGNLHVFSPTASKRNLFAEGIARQLGIRCSAASSPQEAVSNVDLVIAAARSFDEKPILRGAWLAHPVMVVSIGSTLPEQREIDEDVISRSDMIVCDAVDEALTETGDFLAATAARIDFKHKVISLNDLLCGQVAARATVATSPLYKSVGTAMQDIVVAGLALDRAKERNLAQTLPASFLIRS
jgi:alanine dehydrogenase